jgi:hypothetical protein
MQLLPTMVTDAALIMYWCCAQLLEMFVWINNSCINEICTGINPAMSRKQGLGLEHKGQQRQHKNDIQGPNPKGKVTPPPPKF